MGRISLNLIEMFKCELTVDIYRAFCCSLQRLHPLQAPDFFQTYECCRPSTSSGFHPSQIEEGRTPYPHPSVGQNTQANQKMQRKHLLPTLLSLKTESAIRQIR